jgi:hypothetical protein
MRERVLFLGIAFVGTLALSPSGFSQVPAGQTRIPQQIVINGQMASGAYVTAGGGQMQSFSCPSPQHYTTADGGSQGWACYEQTTGVWLLNAVPPAQTQAPQVAPAPLPMPAPMPAPQVIQQQPVVVYQPAPPPTVIYQPPPTVVYQQPATVIYPAPAPTTVVYTPAPSPVIVAPTYPSSVILGRAAIDAAGRIAAAAVLNSHHTREYIVTNNYYDRNRGRDWDRDRHHDRDRGRRW